MPDQKISYGLRTVLVGNVLHLDTGQGIEQLSRQVNRCATARRSEGQRRLAGQGDQFLNGFWLDATPMMFAKMA